MPIPNPRGATYQTARNNYQLAVASRERAIETAEAEIEAFNAREDTDSLTDAQVDQARARVQSAQASIAQANANLRSVNLQIDDRVLRAPFSGTVATIAVSVGETVTTSTDVVTLVSDGDFEVELSVPEIDIAKIEEGMATEITLDAYDNATWQGEITSIDIINSIVEGVPVYNTVVTIVNPDRRIRVGMNARATIEVDRKDNAIAIPSRFIERDGGRQFVTMKNAEDYREVTVETGLRGSDALVEITEGLSEGDVIVRKKD